MTNNSITPLVIEWPEENVYRAYPLTIDSNATVEINGITADFKKILLDAQLNYYTDTPNKGHLYNVVRDYTLVTFTISGLDIFTIQDITDIEFPYYCYNHSRSLLVIGSEILNIPQGNMTLDATFECNVINDFSKYTGLNSIQLPNNTFTSGSINLIEGLQTSINLVDNVLQMEIGRNYGIPLHCQDYFTNNADCLNIISFINGASPIKNGAPIKLIAGTNVKIFEDPERNRIYIGLDFTSDESCVVSELPPVPTTII